MPTNWNSDTSSDPRSVVGRMLIELESWAP